MGRPDANGKVVWASVLGVDHCGWIFGLKRRFKMQSSTVDSIAVFMLGKDDSGKKSASVNNSSVFNSRK